MFDMKGGQGTPFGTGGGFFGGVAASPVNLAAPDPQAIAAAATQRAAAGGGAPFNPTGPGLGQMGVADVQKGQFAQNLDGQMGNAPPGGDSYGGAARGLDYKQQTGNAGSAPMMASNPAFYQR